MDVLEHDLKEFGFGVDPFNPGHRRPLHMVGGLSRDELKQQVIQACPRVPGVYGMLDRSGHLIYVGKSKSLRSRLLSYFSAASEDEKGGRIIESARAIQWETQPSEFAALLREHQLIRLFAPRWNVQGVPKRQQPIYLCLGRDSVPHFYLSRKIPTDPLAMQGPFYGSKRMRVAVEILNQLFKLRDCSSQQVFQFSEQLSLFEMDHRPGCLRLEIGTCLGPCAAACTRNEYDEQVGLAKAFLQGLDQQPIDALQARFDQAMANYQYELASRLHRSIKAISYVQRKLSMLAKARTKYNFIYSVPGYDGCHNWYLIHCGEVIEVASAPKNPEGYQQLKPTLKTWHATLESESQFGHGPFSYSIGTVAPWFRKHPEQLDRTFRPKQAGRKYRQRV
ncbi:UvrABC system protein C [Stieleria bergensis]|uniref:UvrABC system protein C n=1 Tax=Stieleria bergensis TaxID=2528025 RepID=A0A517SW36_9BACT|nr:UvrABC system protein C [Planctomycetes bacterium SV_7m_r]